MEKIICFAEYTKKRNGTEDMTAFYKKSKKAQDNIDNIDFKALFKERLASLANAKSTESTEVPNYTSPNSKIENCSFVESTFDDIDTILAYLEKQNIL